MSLTPKQRAHLRSLAHSLKPVQQIGREGVTDPAVAAVSEAFNLRELIKVKIQQTAPVTASEAGAAIADALPGVEHVQTIGRVAVLYRPHPERPEIRLPTEVAGGAPSAP